MSTQVPNPAQLEPESPLESDPWIYRIAVIALGLTLLLTTAGVFVLFFLQKNSNTFDPGGLVAAGTAAVGALAGLLGGPISVPKTRKATSAAGSAAPTPAPANLAPAQNAPVQPTTPAATSTATPNNRHPCQKHHVHLSHRPWTRQRRPPARRSITQGGHRARPTSQGGEARAPRYVAGMSTPSFP